MIEQSRFTYSPPEKTFEKQIKMIQNQGEKQIKAIQEHGKHLAESMYLSFINPLYFFYYATFWSKYFSPS